MNDTTYRVWFKTETTVLSLPVNPTEISLTHSGENTSYNVIGIGEIITPRRPKLRTVTFESFFPRAGYYQAMINSNAWAEPSDYVNFIRRIQVERSPFKLIIVRGDGYDLNMSAIVTDFTITDKGGEVGDIYYSISVSEWKDAAPSTLEKASEDVETQEINLIKVQHRECPKLPLKPKQRVQVTGKVYAKPDSDEPVLDKTKRVLTRAYATVQRVLPPSASGPSKRVLLSGIGWVDKSDCVAATTKQGDISIDTITGTLSEVHK